VNVLKKKIVISNYNILKFCVFEETVISPLFCIVYIYINYIVDYLLKMKYVCLIFCFADDNTTY